MGFKVTCLALAVIFAGFLAWCLNDMRRNSVEVLEKAKIIADTGVKVSEDVRAMRTLLGVSSDGNNFVQYATRVLTTISASGPEALIGKDEKMADAKPASEWVNGARKEALALALLESSENAILTRLCQTHPPFRKDFYIQIEKEKPQKLIDWVSVNLKKD